MSDSATRGDHIILAWLRKAAMLWQTVLRWRAVRRLVRVGQHGRAFFVTQGAHILLFLTVNIIFGALGFLSPICLEYAATEAFYPAMQKQLDAAGPYTFSIAFLSSTIAYVVAEYLDREEVAQFRPAKVMLSAAAGLIIVCCAIFSGAQTWRTMGEPITQQSSMPAASMQTGQTPQQYIEKRVVPPETKEKGLSNLDLVQIYATLAAIVVGLALFLLFQYQSPSMKAQIERIESNFDADAASFSTGIKIGGD